MEYLYKVYRTIRSYFTLKLESALNYYGVPWQHVTKGLEHTELVEKRSATHQIPVLQTPESSDFARYILKLMQSTYLNYLKANTVAVENGRKSFVAEMYGEAVSYKSLAYREESRQMLIRWITHQSTADERKNVRPWKSGWSITG